MLLFWRSLFGAPNQLIESPGVQERVLRKGASPSGDAIAVCFDAINTHERGRTKEEFFNFEQMGVPQGNVYLEASEPKGFENVVRVGNVI